VRGKGRRRNTLAVAQGLPEAAGILIVPGPRRAVSTCLSPCGPREGGTASTGRGGLRVPAEPLNSLKYNQPLSPLASCWGRTEILPPPPAWAHHQSLGGKGPAVGAGENRAVRRGATVRAEAAAPTPQRRGATHAPQRYARAPGISSLIQTGPGVSRGSAPCVSNRHKTKSTIKVMLDGTGRLGEKARRTGSHIYTMRPWETEQMGGSYGCGGVMAPLMVMNLWWWNWAEEWWLAPTKCPKALSFTLKCLVDV
jgi:hypothetical protein